MIDNFTGFRLIYCLSIRYTASMAAHILVYMVAWAFLSNSKGINMKLIGPADSWRFLVSMFKYIIKLAGNKVENAV